MPDNTESDLYGVLGLTRNATSIEVPVLFLDWIRDRQHLVVC
jgi:hypothetical protein